MLHQTNSYLVIIKILTGNQWVRCTMYLYNHGNSSCFMLKSFIVLIWGVLTKKIKSTFYRVLKRDAESHWKCALVELEVVWWTYYMHVCMYVLLTSVEVLWFLAVTGKTTSTITSWSGHLCRTISSGTCQDRLHSKRATRG